MTHEGGDMVELDVRALPPREKHPRILEILSRLQPGDSLRITNDHDPKPLRYQLDAEHPQEFGWTYCDSGPEVWVVDITRR
jgi:uncharacterized protein (DUF2249 family)